MLGGNLLEIWLNVVRIIPSDHLIWQFVLNNRLQHGPASLWIMFSLMPGGASCGDFVKQQIGCRVECVLVLLSPSAVCRNSGVVYHIDIILSEDPRFKLIWSNGQPCNKNSFMKIMMFSVCWVNSFQSGLNIKAYKAYKSVGSYHAEHILYYMALS